MMIRALASATCLLLLAVPAYPLSDILILRDIDTCTPTMESINCNGNAGPGLDWGLLPDGSEAIFFTGSEYSRGGDVYRVDPVVGVPELVIHTGRAWEDVTCAPDGMQIAIKDNTDYPYSQIRLYSLELDGLLERTTGWTNNRSPDLGYRGQLTEVYPTWGASSDIAFQTRFGALRRPICGFSGREGWNPVFDSADEDYCYYTLDPDRYGPEWGRIMHMPVDGSDCPGQTIYMPVAQEHIGGLSISPDGSLLAYVRQPWGGGQKELVIAELDPVTRSINSSCVALADATYGGDFYTILAFSPDSRDLAIVGSPPPVHMEESEFAADGTPPACVAIHAVSPNPFNPSTEITLTTRKPGRARLSVYDLAGRSVATLFDGVVEAGELRARWNGIDHAGRPAPSGAYVLYLRTDEECDSMTVMLVR